MIATVESPMMPIIGLMSSPSVSSWNARATCVNRRVSIA